MSIDEGSSVGLGSRAASSMAASSSAPIDSSNIGFQMLKKHGWKEGTGLGVSEQGRLEPVQAFVKKNKRGLGAEKKPKKEIKHSNIRERDDAIEWEDNNYHPTFGSVSATLNARDVIYSQMGLHFTLEDLLGRERDLRRRYRVFKWILSVDGVKYDEEKNVVLADEDKWKYIFEREELGHAYVSHGEPCWRELRTLFMPGRAVVPNILEREIICLSSDKENEVKRKTIEVSSTVEVESEGSVQFLGTPPTAWFESRIPVVGSPGSTPFPKLGEKISRLVHPATSRTTTPTKNPAAQHSQIACEKGKGTCRSLAGILEDEIYEETEPNTAEYKDSDNYPTVNKGKKVDQLKVASKPNFKVPRNILGGRYVTYEEVVASGIFPPIIPKVVQKGNGKRVVSSDKPSMTF